MVNLTPITTNCLKIFRDIGADKKNLNGNDRRDRILAFVPSLTLRYALYLEHFASNTLEQIPVIHYSQKDKDDLLHCYSSETKSLNKLISDIKDNQPLHLRGICQFCGINTDSTTDHYLPKGDYPDYCVNALNLFPCCPDCNSLKGEYMWDATHNTRGIVNFYTDNIPNSQFLYATISYAHNMPVINFSLQNNNGISPPFYSIVLRHFSRLNLLSRYKEKFNSVHHQVRSSFLNKPRFSHHPGRVRDFLLDDANQLFNDYGRNYYVGIIKEALANDNVFISQF